MEIGAETQWTQKCNKYMRCYLNGIEMNGRRGMS